MTFPYALEISREESDIEMSVMLGLGTRVNLVVLGIGQPYMLTSLRRESGVRGHLSFVLATPSPSESWSTGSGAVTVMVTSSKSVSEPSETVKRGV